MPVQGICACHNRKPIRVAALPHHWPLVLPNEAVQRKNLMSELVLAILVLKFERQKLCDLWSMYFVVGEIMPVHNLYILFLLLLDDR